MATTPESAAQRGEMPTSPRLIAAVPQPPKYKQLTPKPTYNNDPGYKARMGRWLKLRSGKRADYIARSYSGELYVMRAFIVFHQTLHFAKLDHSGMTDSLFTYLLGAKLFCTYHNVESFNAKQVKLFTNHLFYRSRSTQRGLRVCVALWECGYLNPLRSDNHARVKWSLSMKARSLFRDIEREFNKPFAITSPFSKPIL